MNKNPAAALKLGQARGVALLVFPFMPGTGREIWKRLGVPKSADEGRYAEIPREMIETGDYVTQRLNGLPFLEKPPLLAWSVAASYGLFGRSEAAARIPVKLASVGLVLLTLAWGLNWPIMKMGVADYPPLTFRAISIACRPPMSNGSCSTTHCSVTAPSAKGGGMAIWPPAIKGL